METIKKDIFGVVRQPQFDTNLIHIGRILTIKYKGGDRKTKNDLPYKRSVTGMISYTSPFLIEVTSVLPEDGRNLSEDHIREELSVRGSEAVYGVLKKYPISIEDVLNGIITIEDFATNTKSYDLTANL